MNKQIGIMTMTAEEESGILYMGANGYSMSRTAEVFNIHRNTVKKLWNFHGVDYCKHTWPSWKGGCNMGKCL